MKNRPTVHHIVPRAKNGSNRQENRTILPENKHRALHVIFWIEEVADQIKTILEINNNAIQGDFKADILKVLDLYDWLIYHNWVKKWKI